MKHISQQNTNNRQPVMKRLHKILRSASGNRMFLRSVYAETLLEDFFIAAVVSVLTIRFLLQVTAYPKIEVGGIHIAHILLGGLLMLIAFVILLAFINHSARELAAVIGGIGFGTFIDELGKFITSDNDYFFEPAIALIYVIFVLLFFLIRMLSRREASSGEQCIANAFELAMQASTTGLKSEEQQAALDLLDKYEGEHITSQNLKTVLKGIAPARSNRSAFMTRLKEVLNQFYEYVAAKWWFNSVIVGFFAFAAVTSLSALVAEIQWSLALALWFGGGVLILAALFLSRRTRVHYMNILVSVAIVIVSILISWAILSSLKQLPLSLIAWAQFIFPSVSSVIIIMGLLLIPVSRVQAYRMFRWAILISIFLTQVLSFYADQLLALVGLLINIVILLALRYMIHNEEAKLRC